MSISTSTPRQFSICDEQTMAQRPVLSVLILAYNHAAYLADAIEGVLAQQVKFPMEVLIGEDCSTDSTREIAVRYQQSHPGLIKIITADRNVGLLANWQRLIAASRGEYLAHLDGDDYWLPGKLATQVDYLAGHPECAAVYTGAITVDDSGRMTGFFNDIGTAAFDLAAMLRRGNFLNLSSMVFRAELKPLLLELDEVFIDYRVHLRLARAGLLVQLGDRLAAYRVNATGSMTTTSNELVRRLYWEAIIDVPAGLVGAADFAAGLADFLRRVASRAIRQRRGDLLRLWAPKIYAASPYGIVRTTLLALGSATRATALAVHDRLFQRKGKRALHRR